jgi:hypothetical protein
MAAGKTNFPEGYTACDGMGIIDGICADETKLKPRQKSAMIFFINRFLYRVKVPSKCRIFQIVFYFCKRSIIYKTQNHE